MIDRLVDKAIALNAIEEADAEIYRYSYSVLLMLLPTIVVVLAFGWLLGCLRGSAIMLLFFIPLRQFAGGMHTGSKAKCLVITLVVFLAIMVIPSLGVLEAAFFVQAILVLPATILIYVLSPQDDKNKPLSDNEKSHYKKVARIVLAIEVFVALLLYVLGGNIILQYFTLSAINLTGINVTLKAIQNIRTRKRPV